MDAIRREQQRRKGRQRIARRAALALVAAAFVGSGVAVAGRRLAERSQRNSARRPAIGSDDGCSVTGRPAKVSLARFRGQVVLISFWAPWCTPCIQQEPELAKINRELRAKNIGTVVLVSAELARRNAENDAAGAEGRADLAHLRALLNRAEG
ncbi:MAG TPA: TlpA disulfide reductase family protein [Solirubrobacteraceae bacterium]|nr:TlpA disulfide reductase family protein [Solirubrobacteraceae bacterium]